MRIFILAIISIVIPFAVELIRRVERLRFIPPVVFAFAFCSIAVLALGHKWGSLNQIGALLLAFGAASYIDQKDYARILRGRG